MATVDGRASGLGSVSRAASLPRVERRWTQERGVRSLTGGQTGPLTAAFRVVQLSPAPPPGVKIPPRKGTGGLQVDRRRGGERMGGAGTVSLPGFRVL